MNITDIIIDNEFKMLLPELDERSFEETFSNERGAQRLANALGPNGDGGVSSGDGVPGGANTIAAIDLSAWIEQLNDIFDDISTGLNDLLNTSSNIAVKKPISRVYRFV